MKCFSCYGKGCNTCQYTGRRIIHTITESNERYTPAFIIEAARSTMGCIDCDPASSKAANERVKATRYYDYKTDGLKQEWYGNIWCNPPYGLVPGLAVGLQELFIRKGIEAYDYGYATQVMLLLNVNSPFNPCFDNCWKHSICFYRGRVNFIDRKGANNRRSFGSVIVYMGDNTMAFIQNFSQYGAIVPAGSVIPYTGNRLPDLTNA